MPALSHHLARGASGHFAQTDPQAEAFEAVLLMGGLVMTFAGAVAIVMYLRRRMRSSHRDAGGGFTLADLRRLRNQGELTIAEYETLRNKLLQAKMGSSEGES